MFDGIRTPGPGMRRIPGWHAWVNQLVPAPVVVRPVEVGDGERAARYGRACYACRI